MRPTGSSRLPECRRRSATWASFTHHERVDGRGYPFHVGGERLSLESRIVAVADVFTALTEDRPYPEAGMGVPSPVARIMKRMGGGSP